MVQAVVEVAEVPVLNGMFVVGFDGQFVLESEEKLVYVFCVFKP